MSPDVDTRDRVKSGAVAFVGRCLYRLLNIPSCRKTFTKRGSRNLAPSGANSLHSSHRLPPVNDSSISPHVVLLLLVNFPSYVAGCVWSVIVDAAKRVFGAGTHAYAGKERLKAIVPFLANLDATGTVVLVVSASRVTAPILH